MDTAQGAKMFFFVGRNPQVFYWFKCVSSQCMLQLVVSQGTTAGLQLRSKPPEMFVCCCMGGCSHVPIPA